MQQSPQVRMCTHTTSVSLMSVSRSSKNEGGFKECVIPSDVGRMNARNEWKSLKTCYSENCIALRVQRHSLDEHLLYSKKIIFLVLNYVNISPQSVSNTGPGRGMRYNEAPVIYKDVGRPRLTQHHRGK